MSMEFSLFLPTGFGGELGDLKDPVAAYELLVELAQTAEEAGFHTIWLPDHLQTIPQSQAYLFESWSLLTALAARTERIRLGHLVTGNGYRNPALQAKMASTVDVISGGRLTFGIGAGWYETDYTAFGYDFPSGPVRLRQLDEAVQIIRSLWTQDVTSFEGEHYRVVDAVNRPRGVQAPRIPMMIAGGGEKVTLKLVAKYADVYNVIESPDGLKHKFAVLEGHCDAVGRPYEEIRRTTVTTALLADTDETAAAQIPPSPFFPGDLASYGLVGTPDTVRERIAGYENVGVQELVVGFHEGLDPEAIRRFGREFVR